MLELHQDALWVFGGDFNCVLKTFDIEHGMGYRQKCCPALKDLVLSYYLCDVFHFKFHRRQEFTFFTSGKAPSRLDRFYTTRGLLESLFCGEECGFLV